MSTSASTAEKAAKGTALRRPTRASLNVQTSAPFSRMQAASSSRRSMSCVSHSQARNTHARTVPRGGLETPGLVRQVDADHGVGSAGRRRGGSAARSFLAQCLGNAQIAWCGCAVLAFRSLAKFNLQARVSFNFFYDFVIARHHIDDRDSPSLGGELA